MTEKSKYDTNPLDHDAARRAAAAFGDEATRTLPNRDTGPQGELAEDAPTRRYDGNAEGIPYPSVYQPQPAPNPYQTPYAPGPDASPPYAPYQQTPGYQYPPPAYPQYPAPLAQTPPLVAPPTTGTPTSRPVAGLNLPENLMLIAPYIPMYIGAIAGLVELFTTPHHEKRVRFHAAQGLALHLAVIILTTALGVGQKFGNLIGGWTGLLGLAAGFVSVASTIYFIVQMVKVWKGEAQPIDALHNLTAWLNENIAPRGK